MKADQVTGGDRSPKMGPGGGGPGPARFPGAGPGRNVGRLLLFIALGALVLFVTESLFGTGRGGARIPYSLFRNQLGRNNVARVQVRGDEIQGLLRKASSRVTEQGDTVRFSRFTTYVPSFGDPKLLSDLETRGVQVDTRPARSSDWWPILWAILPFALLLILGWMIFRRMRQQAGGMFNIGKAGAKLYDVERDERTTFDDVAGAEGPKKELRQIIEFLKDPERFHRLGARIPTGVLLVGSPGTGKTLMARAVAGEAGVPFFSISGSDFMEMFVGVGAKRVRDLFQSAKKASPSIVFIDELDSIGRRRGAGLGGGHDEREQTLNQLLSELDGFEPTTDVIVMAATNRPDILDSALLRPGRFDRRVTVHLPTARQRQRILEIHARGKPLDPAVDLEELARGTPGLSGADLENLLNEAALVAAGEGEGRITPGDLEEARDKVLMGLEREGVVLTEKERRILAYHEAGHALVAAVLPETDPIHKVTIVPRGRAMGVTQQLPNEDRYVYEKEYLLDRAAVMMGGRASEELVFDTSTTGAEDDLRQATRLARKMVLDFGMSDRLGPISPGGRREQVFLGEELGRGREYSDRTAREVDVEVKRLVGTAYDRAEGVLRDHRPVLDRIAERLMETEQLTGAEVLAILDGGGEPSSNGDGGRSEPSAAEASATTAPNDGAPPGGTAATASPARRGG